MSVNTWHDLFVYLPEVSEKILDALMRRSQDSWADIEWFHVWKVWTAEAEVTTDQEGSIAIDIQDRKLNHLLPLRLVSRDLKSMVDNYGKVWSCFDGDQPLLYPTILGHVDNMEKLLARGVDVNKRGLLRRWRDDAYWFPERDDEGLHLGLPPSPLDLAARHGILASAKVLLQNGAKMDPSDAKMEAKPIHHASKGGHIPIMDLLVSKGMDINSEGAAALTPLHHAAGRGHKEVAEWLIRRGADVNAHGCLMSPLALAMEAKRDEVAQLLRVHGGERIDQTRTTMYCKLCDRYMEVDDVEWSEHKQSHPNWHCMELLDCALDLMINGEPESDDSEFEALFNHP